jgi:hypothetical protein
MNEAWKRPQTAAQVCDGVDNPEMFGRNVRDWQHELRKVHSRPEFSRRVSDPPPLLRERLHDDGQSDAYLAAYVEWLCERADIEAPAWTDDPRRIADRAWYDYPPLWKQALVHAPSAFRRRSVFTKPEAVLQLRPGRPRHPDACRRRANAERQKRYRARVREKLARLKRLEGEEPNST